MKKNIKKNTKTLLDKYSDMYNRPEFIEKDPISIPRSFDRLQDKEIAGFFAATFAWGQRVSIIQKSKQLMSLMDNSPHDFILHHEEKDLIRFASFKHRTFQFTDTLYFIDFLKRYYQQNQSLEDAFLGDTKQKFNAYDSLAHFHELFFEAEYAPERSRKHLATPTRKSTCKRLNMFLRWMCRKDERGVDLGLWGRIPMSELMIPLDVHVEKTARKLGLLQRKQRDWLAVEELTAALKAFDPQDPVRYDFALFGMSILEEKALL